MANILIVEDEKSMQEIIAEYMQRGGHTCFMADDGMDALLMLKNNPMDLMILDIMMPHLDGFSVCRMTREMSNLPIIMLTAKSSEDDKLKGYDLGADDYITKPFSPKVLLAKAKALLRRSSVLPADTVNAGKISIIPASHKVFVEGQEITLNNYLTGYGDMTLKERPEPWIRILKPFGKNWAGRAGISLRLSGLATNSR